MVDLIEQFFELQHSLEEDAASPGKKKLVLKGICQRADWVNENKRIYERKLLAREVGKLQEKIKNGEVTCELDHPLDGKSRLEKAASRPRLLELKDNGEVYGEWVVLETRAGKDLQALIDGGVRVGFSSRGSGTVRAEQRKGETVDVVNDDYKLLTFDHVAGQSVAGAMVTHVVREQKETKMNSKISELQKDEALWKEIQQTVLESEDGKKAVGAAVEVELEALATQADAEIAESAEGDAMTEAEIKEGEELAETLVQEAERGETFALAVLDLARECGYLDETEAPGNGESVDEKAFGTTKAAHHGDAGQPATRGPRSRAKIPSNAGAPYVKSEAVETLEQRLEEQGQAVEALAEITVQREINEAIAAKVTGHPYADELTEALRSSGSAQEVEQNFPLVEQRLKAILVKGGVSDFSKVGKATGSLVEQGSGKGSYSAAQITMRRRAGLAV